MKWVTRERPVIDRIACPWLITRFIDKEPEFRHFHLDSQTMPIQDYLEVYPEKKEKLQGSHVM